MFSGRIAGAAIDELYSQLATERSRIGYIDWLLD